MQPGDPRSIPSQSHTPIPFWGWGLVLALAVALRLPGYSESVWIDELYTSHIFTGQPIVLLKTLYSDIHPPAYFVFIHFWNRVFGDGEVMLRLPALLCGLASILLCARLVSTRLGPGAGLVSALLLTLSPVHIWYSQEARPYSAGVFLVLAALVARDRWLAQPQRSGAGWCFALLLFGAVFLHYYMAVFPLLFAGLALAQRRGPWRGIVLVCGFVLTLLAIYMGAKLHFSEVPTSKGYLRGFDLHEAWRLFFEWFLSGRSLSPLERPPVGGGWPLLVLQVLAVPVFLRGVWRLLRSGGVDLLLVMLALPTFLFGLNLIGLDQTYIERSALPSLPLFGCVLAAGLTGLRSTVGSRVVLSGSAIAAAGILTAFFLRGDAWTVYKPNPDWRSAAAWIGGRLDEDAPAHLDSDYISPTALSYYDSRLQESKNFERNTSKIEGLFDKASGLFGSDGFPGEQVQSSLKKQIDAYDAYLEGMEQGTLVRIHELAVTGVPQSEPGARRFLLVHGHPTPPARAILDDPSVTVVDQAEFRSLALYELAW